MDPSPQQVDKFAKRAVLLRSALAQNSIVVTDGNMPDLLLAFELARLADNVEDAVEAYRARKK